MSKLKDKVAIVTGASSGIGASIAETLSQHGVKVVLTGRNEARLYDVARQLHIGIENNFSPAKKAHPAFAVHNATEVRKNLELQEVEIIYGDELEGADRFYIYDPFGNRIEIIEWL